MPVKTVCRGLLPRPLIREPQQCTAAEEKSIKKRLFRIQTVQALFVLDKFGVFQKKAAACPVSTARPGHQGNIRWRAIGRARCPPRWGMQRMGTRPPATEGKDDLVRVCFGCAPPRGLFRAGRSNPCTGFPVRRAGARFM